MKNLLRLCVALIGMLFVVAGLRWLVDPSAAAAQLGMPLLDGLGRSSQIGDLTGFFLTLGVLVLLAVLTARRLWYYPAIMLLGIAAFARVLAWLLHDASLAIAMIAVEVFLVCLLIFASRMLTERE